jgi:hypothetical protein
MNIRIEFIIAGITILAASIGWGITKVVSTLKELINVVTEFRIVMAALKEDSKNMNEKHGVVDTRLNAHSAKIEAHGVILAEHEVKIKELQNKK